jgi:hypothetical protein
MIDRLLTILAVAFPVGKFLFPFVNRAVFYDFSEPQRSGDRKGYCSFWQQVVFANTTAKFTGNFQRQKRLSIIS